MSIQPFVSSVLNKADWNVTRPNSTDSRASAASKKGHDKGKGKGKGEGKRGDSRKRGKGDKKGKGDRSPAAPATTAGGSGPSYEQVRAENEKLKLQNSFPRWCEQFRKGKCTKGDACLYKHMTDAEIREEESRRKTWIKAKTDKRAESANAAPAAAQRAKSPKGKAKAKAKARPKSRGR